MDGLLAGKLAYVFLVAVLDAAVLSWLALLWYRRSVRTLMGERGHEVTAVGGDHGAGAGTPAAMAPAMRAPAPQAAGPARPTFALFEPTAADDLPAPGSPRWPRRRLVVAYGLGAAVYALVITGGQLLVGGETRPWVAWVAAWWVHAWPVLPALVALLVLDRRGIWRLLGGYLGAGAVGMALLTVVSQFLRGTLDTAPLTNPFWMMTSLAWTAAAPLLLILITGWRRIRAVTPLALASTLMFGFGLVLFREGMLRAFDVGLIQRGLLSLSALSSTHVVYYGLFLLMSLPLGVFAWIAIRTVATRFEGKAFSDVQLVVDCWWLIVTADTIAVLSTKLGVTAIVIGVAAFVAYRTVVALGLRGEPVGSASSSRRLLLLRVFGYQARTERLFDRVAARWRLHGPVLLVAGADLAMRTVDPGDILRFLGGRMAEQYVASPRDVGSRVAGLDERPDPDGRYRVNDLFCHDDTWQPTVEALLDVSDCVLMDVRSFSEHNQGCVFELNELVWRLPTDAIVLVVDRSTDLPRLGAILERAWETARRSGRSRGDGRLSLVRVERNRRRELNGLWRRLTGVGEPRRILGSDDLASLASSPP